MPKRTVPRSGSLQYWPRKRARKFLPSVNWNALSASASSSISGKKGLLGFIVYKAGMASAIVKDMTADSMTKDKKIAIPVTILECPSMKIFSVRIYKNGIVKKEILNSGLEKNLKRKLKLPKQADEKKVKEQFQDIENKLNEYDDIRVIVYSQVFKTGLKKTPDISEIALAGTLSEKLNFVKENLNKEILFSNVFNKNDLIDIRGLTIGRGFQGPMKRFGIGLKAHKSEKGRRRPGSLGPWHPARVTFHAPQAGQLGMFTRIACNNKLVDIKKAQDAPLTMEKYGNIKTEYAIIRGSVQGPEKRQLLLTNALRKTKKQEKKKFELINLQK